VDPAGLRRQHPEPGHDAPFFVANGMFSRFTGFDPSSGVGADGPTSFREVNRIGIDLPQVFLEMPLRSVSIRPELRVDRSPDARPYNDQTSRFQFVPAIDVIVRF
jgi:hypothetical protein